MYPPWFWFHKADTGGLPRDFQSGLQNAHYKSNK